MSDWGKERIQVKAFLILPIQGEIFHRVKPPILTFSLDKSKLWAKKLTSY